MITRDTDIELLLATPGVVTWFVMRGISPFSCFGAYPGTVGRLLEARQVADPEGFILELNTFLDARQEPGP